MPYPSRGLFFHHVAKTGGTSFVEAMRNITPQELQSTQPVSLTMEFVQALLADGLRPGQFIYGHVATGAALPLRGRTQIITLLRRSSHTVDELAQMRDAVLLELVKLRTKQAESTEPVAVS